MPDIFQANIAGRLSAVLGPMVFDVTLIKVTPNTRTPGSLTAGTNSVEASVVCRGWVDEYRQEQVNGTIVQQGDKKVSLLGASLGAQAPEVGDKVTAEGETRRIVSVRRDPAGAVYECQGR